MISVGMMASFSQLSAHIPRINPNMLKVSAVMIRNNSIQNGCAIVIGTNRFAVANMIEPRISDFVAAAPTNPISISITDTGADCSS